MNSNNVAKTIAASVIGKTPYVGGLLSGLVDAFWPTTGPTLWDQIKSEVEALVSQDIAKYNMQELQLTLQGLKDAINAYLQLTDQSQQADALQAIDVTFTENLPKFLNGGPASGFSCFWGMALLHLCVRRDLLQIIGGSANEKLLSESVITYCAFARVGLSRIYNARLSQIQLAWNSDNVPGKNSMWEVSATMTDNKTGDVMFHYQKRYTNGWQSGALIGHDSAYCNGQMWQLWNSLTSELQNSLGSWAFDAIQQMESKNAYTQAAALSLLQSVMDTAEYTQYSVNYYPTTSIYNSPQTSEPQQNTPPCPTVYFERNL